MSQIEILFFGSLFWFLLLYLISRQFYYISFGIILGLLCVFCIGILYRIEYNLHFFILIFNLQPALEEVFKFLFIFIFLSYQRPSLKNTLFFSVAFGLGFFIYETVYYLQLSNQLILIRCVLTPPVAFVTSAISAFGITKYLPTNNNKYLALIFASIVIHYIMNYIYSTFVTNIFFI